MVLVRREREREKKMKKFFTLFVTFQRAHSETRAKEAGMNKMLGNWYWHIVCMIAWRISLQAIEIFITL
jgi:hypothetical protein